jgi:hypothetical protein
MSARPVSSRCRGLLAAWAASAAAAASAQTQTAQTQARRAQFVFVIDDSGSMLATDPNRLATFAVRSLLSMLEDQDEATVVGLNQAKNPDLAPLIDNRAALEAHLDLLGRAYERDAGTPCRPALNRVRDLLNLHATPDVTQVVFFLTDGQCSPGTTPDTAKQYLGRVDTHAEGRFQFYFLRFVGLDYTRSLLLYAKNSGGRTYEVTADDPAGLLKPFADALSRSQGYHAYQLSPRQTGLAAHEAARRVRLLAVTRGDGPKMGFRIDPGPGHKPLQRLAEKSGTHQYPGQAIYRYAALDYRPGPDPVSISVEGAGSEWKLIALPEYLLSVRTTFHAGLCQTQGQPIESFQTGADACVRVELVNHEGKPISDDLIGASAQAVLAFEDPSGRKQTLSPPWVPTRGAFELQLPRPSQEGAYHFTPRVTLADDGGTTIGKRKTVMGASNQCNPREARLEFGRLLPGGSKELAVTFDGNFPPSPGRHILSRAKDAPEGCVRFLVNTKPEGETQTVSSGQRHLVLAEVAPYCGRVSETFHVEADLRLELTGAGLLPTCSVPVAVEVDYRVEVPPAPPEPVVIAIDAGDDARLPITVRGNAERDYSFKGFLEEFRDASGDPTDAVGVAFWNRVDELPIVDPDTHAPVRADHRIELSHAAEAYQPLLLHIDTDTCCPGGSYTTELVLVASEGVQEPLRIFVRADVEPAGMLACWGSTLVTVALVALALLLALYVFNMVRKTTLLSRKRLAAKLVPLRWDRRGMPEPNLEVSPHVRDKIRRELSLWRRALAWLKANPFAFGLPGRPGYRETATLHLAAVDSVFRAVELRLIAELDIYRRLKNEPAYRAGQLLVMAPLKLVAKPTEDGRVCGTLVPAEKLKEALSPRRPRPRAEGDEVELLDLAGTELVQPLPRQDRLEQSAAGWLVG